MKILSNERYSQMLNDIEWLKQAVDNEKTKVHILLSGYEKIIAAKDALIGQITARCKELDEINEQYKKALIIKQNPIK